MTNPDKDLKDLKDLKAKLAKVTKALEALYALRGGLAKPREHRPTCEALRQAEMALYGTYWTEKWEPR